MPCDDSAYSGNLKASQAVSFAVGNTPQPRAVVLYSTSFNHCTITNPGYLSYDFLFTTVSPGDAGRTASLISNNISLWSIVPDLQAIPPSGSSSNGPTGNNAMIILYSITGIITALFLVIIITGAIRAHRHPERYGPRNVIGRPRQSRAKGIARAMLETLPVVRFGDPEERPKKVGEGDIELADEGDRNEHERTPSTAANSSPTANDKAEHAEGDPKTGSPEAAAGSGDRSTQEGNLGCSICTEDFTKGEDVRILPCKHKFHPACVDPWLLNVSGTCPLCRVDLRPPDSSNPTSPTAETDDPTNTLPPPLPEHGPDALPLSGPPQTTRRRDTIRSVLNFNRMQHASPEERISALRNLRRAAMHRRSTLSANVNGNASNRASAVIPEEQQQQPPPPPPPPDAVGAGAGTSPPPQTIEPTSSTPSNWRERIAGRFGRR
ncbi:MAG: hypothetical protein Q9227_002828 [Pyrenula ochraceoflavens]